MKALLRSPLRFQSFHAHCFNYKRQKMLTKECFLEYLRGYVNNIEN